MSSLVELPREEPDRSKMPVVTMVAVALSLFLFVSLVFLMFNFNKRFFSPKDEVTERAKQREDQKAADEATLLNYGKTDTPGVYRIPIKRAMDKLVQERNEELKESK